MPHSTNKSVLVAGASGLVGSSVVAALEKRGVATILTPSHKTLDLARQDAVQQYFREHQIGTVVIAAAKVGGIHANQTAQADFLYENLAIATHVIRAAAENDVEKLLFLGSACIYPKECQQPIREEFLLSGPLEPTNEGYAIAKIAGLKLCEMYNRQYGKRFISLMPANLYGPRDNFHPLQSHVIPALFRKFHEAKERGSEYVELWGTGRATRDFLHVDDLASAICLALEQYERPETLNVGSGQEVSILELAKLIGSVVGFSGAIRTDASKPDGTPRRVLDISKIAALGWKPSISLRQGLEDTYAWIQKNPWKASA